MFKLSQIVLSILFLSVCLPSWSWPFGGDQNSQAQQQASLEEQKIEKCGQAAAGEGKDRKHFFQRDRDDNDRLDWVEKRKRQNDERKAAKDKLKEEKDKLKRLEKENKLLEQQQRLKRDMQKNQVKLHELNRKQSFKDKLFYPKRASRSSSRGLLLSQ